MAVSVAPATARPRRRQLTNRLRADRSTLRLLLVHRRVVHEHDTEARRSRIGGLLHNFDLHSNLLLSSAGDTMCQRHERRVEAGLVTCRHVHVAKLAVRRRHAPPGTHRDVRAVAAFLPRREAEESSRNGINRMTKPSCFNSRKDDSTRRKATQTSPPRYFSMSPPWG